MAHIVDDRSSAFLEEVRKAMEASRQEAGMPAPTVAPSLADIAVAVRESGLAGGAEQHGRPHHLPWRKILFILTHLLLNFYRGFSVVFSLHC